MDLIIKINSLPSILTNDNEGIAKLSHQMFLDGSVSNDSFVRSFWLNGFCGV